LKTHKEENEWKNMLTLNKDMKCLAVLQCITRLVEISTKKNRSKLRVYMIYFPQEFPWWIKTRQGIPGFTSKCLSHKSGVFQL
jgi:hypothetical protein